MHYVLMHVDTYACRQTYKAKHKKDMHMYLYIYMYAYIETEMHGSDCMYECMHTYMLHTYRCLHIQK